VPHAFEGRAVVFDGPKDYLARIDNPALEKKRIVRHSKFFTPMTA
jgi:hypothetical protein